MQNFQTLGAIVAFATAAFTIWDRLFRGRPGVWFVGRRSGPGEYLDLRIRNFSDVDIILKAIRVLPSRRWVAKDTTVRGAVKASLRGTFIETVSTGSHLDFPVFKATVRAKWFPFTFFIVSWRKASSLWLPQCWCIIWASEKWLETLAKPDGGG